MENILDRGYIIQSEKLCEIASSGNYAAESFTMVISEVLLFRLFQDTASSFTSRISAIEARGIQDTLRYHNLLPSTRSSLPSSELKTPEGASAI